MKKLHKPVKREREVEAIHMYTDRGDRCHKVLSLMEGGSAPTFQWSACSLSWVCRPDIPILWKVLDICFHTQKYYLVKFSILFLLVIERFYTGGKNTPLELWVWLWAMAFRALEGLVKVPRLEEGTEKPSSRKKAFNSWICNKKNVNTNF